jgi:molybdopterin-guanine dinucleotide biosynthesis protein A
MADEPFVGVVLTGGASSRMGTDKAFVEVGGRALVLRVADTLRSAGASRVVAVGGDAPRLAALGLEVIPDHAAGQGPLGGIVTALEEVDADVVVVAACDLIAITPAAVREVLAALTPDADAVLPRTDRLEPLMAAYRGRCLAHLRAELDAGERAPHRAVEGLAVVQVRLHEPDALRDADGPDDLPVA